MAFSSAPSSWPAAAPDIDQCYREFQELEWGLSPEHINRLCDRHLKVKPHEMGWQCEPGVREPIRSRADTSASGACKLLTITAISGGHKVRARCQGTYTDQGPFIQVEHWRLAPTA